VLEFLEATALWLLKRWGEYFAMVATSAGIPYEIYELADKITVLRVVAFAINVALVVYLVVSKRLFGVRGGKHAYDARLRSESIMRAAIDAAAREPAQAGRVPQIPVPGGPAAGGAEPAAGSAEPAAGSAEPAAGSAEPAAGSAGPAAGGAGGAEPGAGEPPGAGQATAGRR
jgi:hypothetical protein